MDHRTDIYALSIILHQMLTGKAPFASAGTGDVLIMHVSAPPPPVRMENPGVPLQVEEAILRGLAKRREERFQTMAELAEALVLPGQPPQVATARRPLAPLRTTAALEAATPLSWALPPTRQSKVFPAWARFLGLGLLVAVPVSLLIATDVVRSPAPVAEPPRSTPAVAAPPLSPARVAPAGSKRPAPAARPPVQAKTDPPPRSTPPSPVRVEADPLPTGSAPAAVRSAPAAVRDDRPRRPGRASRPSQPGYRPVSESSRPAPPAKKPPPRAVPWL